MKDFFKKIWLKIKKYWWIFAALAVIIVAVVCYGFLGGNTKFLEDLSKKLRERAIRHEQELKRMDAIRKEHIAKQEKVDQAYRQAVETIEREYLEEVRQLSFDEKKQIREIVEKSEGDPDQMAKNFQNTFGFRVVEGDKTNDDE